MQDTLMTKYRTVYRIIVSSALALSVTTAAHAASYTVTDLGTLGGTDSLGWGINARGQVTGYATTTDDETVDAFLWNPTTPGGASGTMYDLSTLGGSFSWGIGINDSGQVAGISATTGDAAEHATLWIPTTPNGSSGTLHDLGTLGGTYSQGTGINNSGQVTGYSDKTGDSTSRAIMWKPTTPGSASGTMHELGSLGGSVSFGWDINASGQVTGNSDTTDDEETHAFLWNPMTPNGVSGMMHDLGTLGGTSSDGGGINASGQVAGSSLIEGDEFDHAFLWTPTTPGGTSGSMLDLGTLAGSDSYGYNVNAAGQVVGLSYVPAEVSNYSHAFLYTPGVGMVDLNILIDPLSGWELLDASEINDAGQITGQGLINDEYHAYLLTPIPIPGDFNNNGTVDAADYVVWRKTGGSPDDYSAWQTNFGRSFFTGSGSGATGSASAPAIPEPASLTLFLITALALFIARRSRVSLSPLSASPPLPQGGQKSLL
jgi:probable HAF family extracellular repeat protein